MGDGDAEDLWQGTQGQELKKSRPENVNFAKKAKRVDVKRLKDDIWSGLRTLIPEDKRSDVESVSRSRSSRESAKATILAWSDRLGLLDKKRDQSRRSTRSFKIYERPILKRRCLRSRRPSASSVSSISRMKRVYRSRRLASMGGMGTKGARVSLEVCHWRMGWRVRRGRGRGRGRDRDWAGAGKREWIGLWVSCRRLGFGRIRMLVELLETKGGGGGENWTCEILYWKGL